MPHLDALKMYSCGKHCEKRRNCLVQAISPFLSMFFTLYGSSFSFGIHFKLSSAICFNLDQSKILSSGNGLTHPSIRQPTTTPINQSTDPMKQPTNQPINSFPGQRDLVRCYFCGLGLKDFISSDDPLIEHVRYSEGCEFLIQLLGPSRLREIKVRFQT